MLKIQNIWQIVNKMLAMVMLGILKARNCSVTAIHIFFCSLVPRRSEGDRRENGVLGDVTAHDRAQIPLSRERLCFLFKGKFMTSMMVNVLIVITLIKYYGKTAAYDC